MAPMKAVPTAQGDVYVCDKCGARAAHLAALRRESAPRRVKEFVHSLWSQVTKGPRRYGKNCPHCAEAMITTRTPGEADPLSLDVCARCGYVFFEPDQYSRIYGAGRKVRGPARPAEEPPVLFPPGAKAPAVPAAEDHLASVSKHDKAAPRDEDEPVISLRQPDSGWQYIPALLGLPIEMGTERTAGRPLVTWGLSLVMVVIYFWLWASGGLMDAIDDWGYRPDQWYRHDYLTLFTGFFIHAGLYHLLSNLYFFIVFGDNVEGNLGPFWYVFLLATAHLAGGMVHGMYDPHPNEPCVGASAGISGVIAYYAIAFPKSRIGILPSLFLIFFGLLRMPAIVALMLFAVAQIIGAWAQVQGHTNISYLAHLGGLGVGVIVGITARVVMPKVQMGRVAPPVAVAR